MISFENFVSIMNRMKKLENYIETLYQMGIDLYESEELWTTAGVFFDEIIESNFGSFGLDLVFWYLYDKDNKECPNEKIPETYEELYEILIKNV